jgi:hypothetical protein
MNYNHLLIILLLSSMGLPSIAQEYQNQPEYKYYHCQEAITGCYKSFRDFDSGNPFIKSGFSLEKRKPKEARDSRAGGYSLQYPEGSYPDTKFTDKIWGIYFRDTLYLNRKFFQGKRGFDKVYCMGSYGYFHGINPNSGTGSENEVFNSALLFGLVGGAVASAVDSENDRLYGKFPHIMIYLLDYETGMVSPLTSFKLEKILEDDPKLLETYEKEKNKFSMMVMHAYLDTFAERQKNK